MRAAAFVLAALAVMGCKSDVCTQGAAANEAIGNAFAACAAANPDYFGGYSPCFNESGCEASLPDCTEADQALMKKAAACQNVFADSNDCTFVALSEYNQCAANATTLDGGGSALSRACQCAQLRNDVVCGMDAGPSTENMVCGMDAGSPDGG